MAGTTNLPKSARAAAAWNRGNVLVSNGKEMLHMMDLPGEEKIIEVEAIDGMFMATQYDLKWDEECFDGFHFYDVSQSVEFRKAGYKVVVPNDKEVWVLHDSGISSEKRYDLYREKFCKKYEKIGFVYSADDDTMYTLIGNDLEEKKKTLFESYRNETEEVIWQEIANFESLGYVDMEVLNLKNYLEINRNERKKNGNAETCKNVSYLEFRPYYTQIKFWMWRSNFSINDSEKSRQSLWALLDNGILTVECLKVIERQICDGKVCKVAKIFQEKNYNKIEENERCIAN